eukprot:m.58320 g.58320  ORF g.58320 m.58320 type:complete len:97 (+) comp11680_c0_seq1:766-1056(+)
MRIDNGCLCAYGGCQLLCSSLLEAAALRFAWLVWGVSDSMFLLSLSSKCAYSHVSTTTKLAKTRFGQNNNKAVVVFHNYHPSQKFQQNPVQEKERT